MDKAAYKFSIDNISAVPDFNAEMIGKYSLGEKSVVACMVKYILPESEAQEIKFQSGFDTSGTTKKLNAQFQLQADVSLGLESEWEIIGRLSKITTITENFIFLYVFV